MNTNRLKDTATCPSWCPNACTPDDNGEAFHFVQGKFIALDTDPARIETLTAGLVRNDDLDSAGRSFVDLSLSEIGDAVADWSTCMTSIAARQLGMQLIEFAGKAEEANR
jgi:hypothetical protein